MSVINTNVMSLTAQRNLNASQNDLSTAIQRLSSGLRINSAKDDAAGLAIATRMTSQINGLNQAVRNANDGISMAQTTESALGEVTNNLQRIRELAVESANGTYSTADRAALDVEVQQRLSEIDRIASKTTFNGQNVLDGSLGSVDFSTIDATTNTLGVNGISVTGADATNANAAITAVDAALTTVNTARSTLGAVQNRFQSTVANLSSISESTASSRSQIQDADFAAETAAMSRAQILQQAGVSVLSQANSMPQTVLKLLG